MTIKVLIVDDSALIRSLLKEIINSQPGLEVVGVAPHPIVAREMIRILEPDVLTLDVEMPKMGGLDFLERLMRLHPMPVVMISTLTEQNSEVTLRALELGAVDFITKPKIGISQGLSEYAEEIADKIRTAAKAVVKPRVKTITNDTLDHVLPMAAAPRISTEKIIMIGASTGGTEAIKDVLVQLPENCPGILIAQHMPPGFTLSFANRLNSLCRITVKEAEHGELVKPGHAYIAPGHSHLLLQRRGAQYFTELSQEAPVNRHRPSVDVLFRSAANRAGANAFGVILTGMGKDGALGLLDMKRAGAYTIAQNEETCVVFGMPREAIAVGAADEIIPLNDIAGRMLKVLVGGGLKKVVGG